MDTTRRNRLDLNTSAELAIYNAMGEVEKAGSDVRLTNALIKLKEARELVANFVDSIPPVPTKTEQAEQEEVLDLQQYVTNLLYYAHVEAMNMSSIGFDKWVEREIENIKEYFKHKVMIQKIERVPANLVTMPFEKAIDEKIKEMNSNGFRFIPPMTIEESEGTGEYSKPKQAVMLFEKL